MPRPLSRQRARPTHHAGLARLPRRTRPIRGPQEMAALYARRALKSAALRDCGRRCVYCAVPLCPESMTLDHVYPRAKGGPDVAGNVVTALSLIHI